MRNLALKCSFDAVEAFFAVAVVTLPNPLYVDWTVVVYLIVIFPRTSMRPFATFHSARIPCDHGICLSDSPCNCS